MIIGMKQPYVSENTNDRKKCKKNDVKFVTASRTKKLSFITGKKCQNVVGLKNIIAQLNWQYYIVQ